MTVESRRPSGPGFWRFLGVLSASTAGLVAAGWIPTRSLGGEPALRGMVMACLLCFAGSVVGSLPLFWGGFLGTSAGAPAVRALASLGLRFAAVVAGAAAIALAGLAEPRPFLIWVGVSYLALLVVDVWIALARLES